MGQGVSSVAVAAPVRDSAARAYREARVAHWDAVAARIGQWTWNRGYHARLAEIYSWLVPAGQRVLEIGCGTGDLLAATRPQRGVGIDFSPAMIEVARQRHPELTLRVGDAHDLDLGETFDAIILSDLVNDVWDVQTVFEQVRRHCHPSSRIILNFYSRLWELPLRAAQALNLATPTGAQNWLTPEDITNLLHLAGCELVRHSSEILWPMRTPLVAPSCNKVLVKCWPFRIAALTNVIVARPAPQALRQARPRVSVIVPARNEAGNIPEIFERVPEMGGGTELVFVEGHSRDETYAAIEQAIAKHPARRAVVLRQSGEGKGDAVRAGFARATGDILMILDADLTVAPEDLPRFYAALESGHGEFVNGVRLVYPMQARAMRFFNLLGNKFFGLVFSWLLGQPIRDTLCGTKVLWKADYELIAANRSYFGDFDPFGDFDLLFGAAKLSRKIVEMPIRYRERTYGTTNIRRWVHGWLLLRMAAVATRKLKWV
jgi:SAM-dependent methyltransferase